MTESIALCDSHCHVGEDDYALPARDILSAAANVNVEKVITLGGDIPTSRQMIDYAHKYNGFEGETVLAFAGIHPHECANVTNDDVDQIKRLIVDNRDVTIGVGEVGLDYCYDYKLRNKQIPVLEAQIQLALDLNLPLSFHIRSGEGGDAFADFFAILRNFNNKVRGVVHSFTDTMPNLEKVLSLDLYIGVNGIATFNKDPKLAEVYRAIPVGRMVLETDSPYLTPKPYRGKTNQPAYIRRIAEFMADYTGYPLEYIASITTRNVDQVYGL